MKKAPPAAFFVVSLLIVHTKMRLNTPILKYLAVFSVCFLLFTGSASASHLMGGEITWTCQGGGQFVFTLKLYRDCNGVSIGNTQVIYVDNHPVIGQIPVNLVSQTDISPQCNPAGPVITCAAAQQNPPIPGAVEEF